MSPYVFRESSWNLTEKSDNFNMFFFSIVFIIFALISSHIIRVLLIHIGAVSLKYFVSCVSGCVCVLPGLSLCVCVGLRIS